MKRGGTPTPPQRFYDAACRVEQLMKDARADTMTHEAVFAEVQAAWDALAESDRMVFLRAGVPTVFDRASVLAFCAWVRNTYERRAKLECSFRLPKSRRRFI